jgi:hypothetical protein
MGFSSRGGGDSTMTCYKCARCSASAPPWIDSTRTAATRLDTVRATARSRPAAAATLAAVRLPSCFDYLLLHGRQATHAARAVTFLVRRRPLP